MSFRSSTFASLAAMAAALSMAATPAAAAELPRSVQTFVSPHLQVQTGEVDEANQYRRYRRHRHRDRGIDAGDVVAGVVVLGALAAIIGSNRDRNRDRERYEERREQVRYDQREDRRFDSRGIDNAVDICVEQVERSNDRVEEVHEARRAPDGWRIAGTLEGGAGWDCWIDNDGRIRSVDFGGAGYSSVGDGRYSGGEPASGTNGQLSDTAYASARASTRRAADEAHGYRYETTAPSTPSADDPRPAYPGGPLPGEEGYDPDWQVDGDLDDYGG